MELAMSKDRDVLFTKSIFLREPFEEDETEFLHFISQAESLSTSWVDAPRDEQAFQLYLQHAAQEQCESFLVCDKQSNNIIGVFHLSKINYGIFSNALLDYVTLDSAKALMTEGLRLVLRFIFQKLKLHRIEASIQPDDDIFIQLVKDCAFRLEGFSPRLLKINGRWRDHERWAMTIEDWRMATVLTA
jgi:[ribosomal protein S5]-alanine N-acetyltransferase